ncbi:predicted protein [Histoplasma capsulatum G186AR]|uniref:Uncharacterized protein n=1 Tax=Ajellomyces capsulatus (strain G186AR / H82 / ATCC MYA-2454 / RMSCC 2432) TaxID=447093 RepID=C0NCB5_AJECG|nr:uncharacterized protein HCBG_00761 [Histoplasma capsulatum G186AR]EEH11306.1 predicted protein [Histoplasma capsulatum G186AR]
MGGCTTQPRRQEQKATIIRSNCRPGRGCDGINWEIQDCPTVVATGIATAPVSCVRAFQQPQQQAAGKQESEGQGTDGDREGEGEGEGEERDGEKEGERERMKEGEGDKVWGKSFTRTGGIPGSKSETRYEGQRGDAVTRRTETMRKKSCCALQWSGQAAAAAQSSRRRQRAADTRSAADLEVRQGLGAGVARKSPEANSPLTLSCSTAWGLWALWFLDYAIC